ncbi:MAG: GH32 C-terminal domain-containing protein, partial [Rhizobiaceae bacterium]|nr:GH32 C-terminal domain-containing protein [Rhizobiaceae bacterium]
AVEILFELKESGAPFELTLDHPSVDLGIVQDEAGLSIRHRVGDGPSPNFIAPGAKVRRLRIFLDYGSMEVFADHGRFVGTKRIAGFEPVRAARFAAGSENVAHATMWSLRL